MSYPLQLQAQHLSMFGKNWGWLFLFGIALVILGFVAISVAVLTTLISVIFLGFIITIGGIVILIDTFKSWWGKWGGFFLHALMGILYVIVGVMLIKNPILSSVSLTLLLGIFYVIIGLSRIIYSLSFRLFRWGLSLFNGIVSLLLGCLILANWPAASLYIIGLFVGIDLLFCGWFYMMAALSARSFVTNQ